MSFISMLQAAAPAPGSGSMMMSILPFIIIFVIFYFFIIRPQNKKQKEVEKMIAALKKGDKVVTIGGIHGVVSSTKEHTVVIKVDDNSKIEFNRSAIASVIADTKPEKTEKKEVKEKESVEAPAEEKTE